MINIENFKKLEIRVGTIVEASPLPDAKTPAFILKINFGPFGKKTSSAQLTDLYTTEELIDRQVICAVNLKPKNIGSFVSEVLVLGVSDVDGNTVLLKTDIPIKEGAQVK